VVAGRLGRGAHRCALPSVEAAAEPSLTTALRSTGVTSGVAPKPVATAGPIEDKAPRRSASRRDIFVGDEGLGQATHDHALAIGEATRYPVAQYVAANKNVRLVVADHCSQGRRA
jgi:hypothetical protein